MRPLGMQVCCSTQERNASRGDPDAAAEAADREILAVGQLIGLRLADVQIPANIGNSEILILQNIVTHNDLHNFVIF